ncbi:MAG: right-handed parallel beta-helix repeat-containing protein [Bacteroidota bacterium]|jgi:hypothetical protein|nr:right-handed parallel beta-helix repeat-containing protein [Bacteroidota bacterium]
MKKNSKKSLIFSIAALALGTSLQATTYYLSPNGSDNSNGTSATTAWKSLSKLNNMVLPPGTNVLFEGGGIFTGGITIDQSDANDELNVVTFSTYGSGKAIISSGTSAGFSALNTKGFKIANLSFEGAGMTGNSTNGIFISTTLSGNVKLGKIDIIDTDVHNYGKDGIAILSSSGNTGFKNVLIQGVHVYQVKQNGITTRGFTMQSHTGYAHQNITIRNTEVDHVPGYADASMHRGSGIILAQASNSLIEKSVAHHNGTANTHCGGPGGIWAWDCDNLTIQYCESYKNSGGSGCDGLGFDFDGGVTNSLMQYNYSHDNDGAGYLLGQYSDARPWSNNVVRYNISENDGRTNSGGITLFKGSNAVMNGAKIYNNTVYVSPSSTNTGVSAFTLTEWNTGINGVEVYNNIFQSSGGTQLILVPNGYDAAFAGNLYWSSGSNLKLAYHGTYYNSLSAFRSATGKEMVNGIATGINADPMLLNAATGAIIYPGLTTQLNAYKVAAGSPAINGGVNLMNTFGINAGPHDYFNNPINAMASSIGIHQSGLGLTTGISDVAKSETEKISFYPNPLRSGDLLHVKGAEYPYSLEVVSITGASVIKDKEVSTDEYLIADKGLSAGVYIVAIKDNSGKKTVSKLVIE